MTMDAAGERTDGRPACDIPLLPDEQRMVYEAASIIAVSSCKGGVGKSNDERQPACIHSAQEKIMLASSTPTFISPSLPIMVVPEIRT
jgi:hypothetical protein